MVPNAKVAQETQAILNTIRICEKFNTLPRDGGYFSQDSLFVHILQNVLAWDAQRAELDRRKQQSKLPTQ